MVISKGFIEWKRAVHNLDKMPDYIRGKIEKEEIEKDNNNRLFGYLNSNIEAKKKVIDILENEFKKMHSKGGRKPKLSIEDKLNATIDYLEDNKTFLELANKYNIHESNMYESIIWVIKTLEDKKVLSIINCWEKEEYKLDLNFHKN